MLIQRLVRLTNNHLDSVSIRPASSVYVKCEQSYPYLYSSVIQLSPSVEVIQDVSQYVANFKFN